MDGRQMNARGDNNIATVAEMLSSGHDTHNIIEYQFKTHVLIKFQGHKVI